MTIHFADRASSRLNAVRALVDASHASGQAYVEMAKACERAARELNKAAGDFRRAARQQKKTSVAGATNETKN